jgi:steroid 5-alpha reductase family enzyme
MAVVLLVLILVVSGIQKLAEKKMNSGVRVGKRRARK